MRPRTFLWFLVAVALVLLVFVVARREEGGGLDRWLMSIHGR